MTHLERFINNVTPLDAKHLNELVNTLNALVDNNESTQLAIRDLNEGVQNIDVLRTQLNTIENTVDEHIENCSDGELELQVGNGYIQWRYKNDNDWNNLISITDLQVPGPPGPQGIPGKDGTNGVDGATGSDGRSAYEIAVSNGFVGTEQEWLNSLKGDVSGVATGDKIDYMGKQHKTLKETNDSNVDYLLRRVNTQKYEGSSITANNTYAKQVNKVILKGVTKFKDVETGEFLDSFEEGKNLELIGGKSNTIQVKNKLTLKDLICTGLYNMEYTINNNTIDAFGLRWSRVSFNFDYQTGVAYNVAFVSNIEGAFCIDINRDTGNRTNFNKGAFTKDFSPSGNQPLQICIINGKMQLSDFYICKSQYKNEPYKTSQLILSIGNPLYSIGDVYDYIDLVTGMYVKNISIRPYQEGDESNSEVLTDKKNTLYKLQEPVVSKIDLQGQKIYSYDGTTYYNCISEPNYPSPILSMDVPTDLASLVNNQKAEIKLLKEENKDQDELINTTMMATDEMYMMIEPLLAETLCETNVSKMADMYVMMVQRQLKKIEQVPTRYREHVKKIIDQSVEIIIEGDENNLDKPLSFHNE